MKLRSSLFVSAVMVLAATACSSRRDIPPTSAATASPNDAVQTPIVAAGTRFHARLETPLSSDSTRAGDLLTARLDEPLLAGNGTVVAPRGAVLSGRVLEVDRGGPITVAFDRLHIRGRAYPIFTTLLRMPQARVTPSTIEAPQDVATDLYPRAGAMPPNVGGGPPAEASLSTPRDAVMSFVISQPFALPAPVSAVEVQNSAEVDRTFN
jgi:hypothetical protein